MLFSQIWCMLEILHTKYGRVERKGVSKRDITEETRISPLQRELNTDLYCMIPNCWSIFVPYHFISSSLNSYLTPVTIILQYGSSSIFSIRLLDDFHCDHINDSFQLKASLDVASPQASPRVVASSQILSGFHPLDCHAFMTCCHFGLN